MKRFISTCCTMLMLLMFVTLALAVETTAPGAITPAASVVVAPAAPSFMVWFMASLGPIFAVLFSISELMAASPWFKGNGILDTIVKCLKFLMQQNPVTPPPA